jgi:hypothetical protein
MLIAPNLCLLDTSLQPKVINSKNPLQKKVRTIVDVIFDETFTYNNFAPIPTHSIELLQVAIEQALTLVGVAQPHIVGVVAVM